ncbi:hypothetical protein STRAU_3884 [Streptomyces aurantiacus JA 4570]|uniref:Peptidoglycan binding-like domain-containing protein n=1 Tax=Streptomyces aurantiacus JA 4570 TaxID=1286094 RepID=S3ZHG4_9ACTN|nr:hypothetical protein STRAU_3884 [Streptomyces aurantiacus JA 4570]
MLAMGSRGERDPREARDAAALVELMRRLKEQSGLTYRQLEERAAERGEALARSTLADVMRRDALPRPEVLAAFVRACAGGHEVDTWLKARDRIAAGEYPRSDTAAPVRVASLLRRTRLTAVVAALVLTACAWLLAADDAQERPAGGVVPGSGQKPLLLSEECPRVLIKGQHHPCVQELQRQLRRHGLDLPADAVFGPYTKMRVAAFQTFAGLSVTAMGDEATKKALYEKHPEIDVWSPERVERRLREVFPEQPDTAVRLVRCMTQLDPLWIWGNSDGSRQWGLFQFSDLELMELRVAPVTALGPEWSIQRGRALWERTKDFSHWSCKSQVTTAEKRS